MRFAYLFTGLLGLICLLGYLALCREAGEPEATDEFQQRRLQLEQDRHTEILE